TITRPTNPSPRSFRVYKQTGGLSGKPLRMRSTEIVAHIFKQTSGKLPIIGVGGVFHAGDAWEKIIAGATLVQVYTGMVYEGPSIAREIVTGLRELLQEHGFEKVQEAVGLMHRQ
ncbi:MAG: quinone-dependent dihydroorotate dehydrogenase, partial [Verrucomicrobiota bacterium]